MIFALHGNIGSRSDFDFLSDSNDMETFDLWPFSHLSLSGVAAQVREAAKAHRPRGILGYSMGGRIALQSIADSPNFWDFAIIISAHPGLSSTTEKSKRLKTDQNWSRMIRSEEWQDFLKKWNQQSVLSGPTPKGQSELSIYKSNIAEAFQNWSLGSQKDLRPALQNSTCPITWVVGENDLKFSSIGKKMEELRTDIDLVKIPNCGHRVPNEAPYVVKAIVEKLQMQH